MCIPIFLPNTETVIGPIDKNGIQTVNIYTKNDVRKIIKVHKDDVDKYIETKKDADKKCILGTVCGLASFSAGLIAAIALVEARVPKTKAAWAVGILSGLATLLGTGYCIKGISDLEKSTENLEKSEIK